jgi:predicted O-methyltransferase YrrM
MKRFHWIKDIIEKNNYKTMVEVGTGRGKTAQYLLKTCPSLILFEIAYYPTTGYDENSSFKAKRMWKRRIKPYKNRVTILESPSLLAAENFQEMVDIIFIDADHSKKKVAEDIIAWLSKIRPGGLMCGHDFDHPKFPGVREAVTDIFDNNFSYSIDDDHVWWHYIEAESNKIKDDEAELQTDEGSFDSSE